MAFSGRSIPGIPDFTAWENSRLQRYIAEHYCGLIEEALTVSTKTNRAICIGLCLHPQAIAVYDPELQLLSTIVEHAKEHGVLVTSYSVGFNRSHGQLNEQPAVYQRN